MRAILAFAAVLLAATAAGAGEPSDAEMVRAIEAQPGVAVTHGEDGGHPFTEWRRNGVFYRLERRGALESLIGSDESGAGAVMCTWGLYGLVRDALDDCPSDRYPALRADLDRDIAAMDGFIVRNSPLPITRAELRARAAAQRASADATRPPGESRACAAGDVGALLDSLDRQGPDGRRAATEALLAAPRWPVLNPCL